MRWLILADIHSNLEALQAVLNDAQGKYKRILCLGDVVGYGANPNECIEILKRFGDYKLICLMGNHDAAVAGILSLENFNDYAKEAVKWTIDEIRQANLKWLSNLPEFFTMQYLYAVHGSPNEPLTEYMDENVAEISFQKIVERVIFCGHTHIPFVIRGKNKAEYLKDKEVVDFSREKTVISFPSVGQPRDKDNRAGYAIADFRTKTIEIHRVEYDIEAAANPIANIVSRGVEAFFTKN